MRTDAQRIAQALALLKAVEAAVHVDMTKDGGGVWAMYSPNPGRTEAFSRRVQHMVALIAADDVARNMPHPI